MSIHKPKDIVNGDYSRAVANFHSCGEKVCAFCGIAKPDSFKKTLLDAGAQVLSFDILPDHHATVKTNWKKSKPDLLSAALIF